MKENSSSRSAFLNPRVLIPLTMLVGILTAALAPAQEVWVARYKGPGGNDTGYGIAVDGSGNVYVTGSSLGIGTGTDYATIKYDALGAQQWIARYNGPGNSSDVAYAVAVDASGNVYVTGYSAGSGIAYDCTTVKYNSSGRQQWVARYNGPANGDDYGFCIAS